jgi:hypothetical protein
MISPNSCCRTEKRSASQLAKGIYRNLQHIPLRYNAYTPIKPMLSLYFLGNCPYLSPESKINTL